MTSRYVRGEEVADAIAGGRPVVALETTLVTHGLPHPDGVAAALTLEHEVRQCGAIPATIGILRGAIRVGLSQAELNELATTRDTVKVNLSNLAAVVAGDDLWRAVRQRRGHPPVEQVGRLDEVVVDRHDPVADGRRVRHHRVVSYPGHGGRVGPLLRWRSVAPTSWRGHGTSHTRGSEWAWRMPVEKWTAASSASR